MKCCSFTLVLTPGKKTTNVGNENLNTPTIEDKKVIELKCARVGEEFILNEKRQEVETAGF